jgi:hypothetical protein
MQVIDLYEFSLYLRAKRNPGENKRTLCVGAEMRKSNGSYLYRTLMDSVALIMFTPTGKNMLFTEEDCTWRALFVEWVEGASKGSYRTGGFEKRPYAEFHRTEIKSNALIMTIFILMSYHPMYAYDSPSGKLGYTSLLNDFLRMYGPNVNVVHEKRGIVEQTPAEVLSDFLFYCVLTNTMDCLRESASNGDFSSLINNIKQNIEIYHLNFVGQFKVEPSSILSDYLGGINEINSTTNTLLSKVSKRRYQMFSELLKSMTPEDLSEVESVFKELFHFKASQELEETIKTELSNFLAHFPEAAQVKINSILKPLENYTYYVDEVDIGGQRIAQDITERFLVQLNTLSILFL